MFYSKSTGGFYSTEIHGDVMPSDVVTISDAQHTALLAGQSAGQRIVVDAAGNPSLASQTPPSQADIVSSFENAVQAYLDTFAATWRYESILSAASYANSTVPQFKAEALALIAWRDQVWAQCYVELAAVQAGTQAMPASPSAFISTLPASPTRP